VNNGIRARLRTTWISRMTLHTADGNEGSGKGGQPPFYVF
jgi:hypothetical protein